MVNEQIFLPGRFGRLMRRDSAAEAGLLVNESG